MPTLYLCQLCEEHFPAMNKLASHVAEMHFEPPYRPHTCADCAVANFDAGAMGQHGVESAHRVLINWNRREEVEQMLIEICCSAIEAGRMAEEHEPTAEVADPSSSPQRQPKPERDSNRLFIPCLQCGERVQREYGQRRLHVYSRHSPFDAASTTNRKAEQAALKRVMAECFPRERILNDLTCHECFTEVAIYGSGKQRQVKHIQEAHLELELKCVIQGCATVSSSMDRFRFHVVYTHANILDLPRDLKADYDAIKSRVARDTAAVYGRYFPAASRQSRLLNPRRDDPNEEMGGEVIDID